MMVPEVIIKSQVVDDKNKVYLIEILEKYGVVIYDGEAKTITFQIYNKIASDENKNSIKDDSNNIGFVVINGSITVTKWLSGEVYIQGMLVDINKVHIPYLEIPDGSYENGIELSGIEQFDLYVIRV